MEALQGVCLEGLKVSPPLPSPPPSFLAGLGHVGLLAGQVQEHVVKDFCFSLWPPLTAMEQITRALGSWHLWFLPRASTHVPVPPRTGTGWAEGILSRGVGAGCHFSEGECKLRLGLDIVSGFQCALRNGEDVVKSPTEAGLVPSW